MDVEERVLAALRLEQADRVPVFIYLKMGRKYGAYPLSV